jgi:hypothetical protein
MNPKMCDGFSSVNGNRKPVTLVRTVVAKKTAVQPANSLAFSIP